MDTPRPSPRTNRTRRGLESLGLETGHAPVPGRTRRGPAAALTVPAASRLEGQTGEATVELQTEGGYQNVYIWGARGGAGDCIAWH